MEVLTLFLSASHLLSLQTVLVALALVHTLQQPQLSLLVQPGQAPHLLLLTLFFLLPRVVGDDRAQGLRFLSNPAASSFTPLSPLTALATPQASTSGKREVAAVEGTGGISEETGTGLGPESSSEHCRLGEGGLGAWE